MTETKPRAEQIRFNSSKTGEHTLDDYIESAERPGQTIGSLLDQIFDVDGYIKTDLFEFRIKDAGGGNYTLQYRSGSYVDPEANWADISQAVFDQILDAAELAKTQAQTAATTATTQAGISTTQATTSTTQAGIATTQAGIATTQANAAIAAAAGMKRKAPVRAATTAALPSCTYANGSSGVGATLTATANGALPAQDTVTLLVGEGLLVKNQASAQHNGLYVVTQVGSGGTPWILTRQTDSDTWSEIVAAVVTVMEGSAGNADIDYLCTSNSGGTMGTTAITWQAYNATIADGAVSTAAKIANNIITYAKILSTEIATVANITGRIASKFVSAVALFDWAEDRVTRRVYSANISAGATVSITSVFRNGYNYRIEIDNFQLSGSTFVFMHLSSDNGATYITGASDYTFTGSRASSALAVNYQATSAGIYISGDNIDAAGGSITIYLFNPVGTSKKARTRSSLSSSAGGNAYFTETFGLTTNNVAANALRLSLNSGTFLASGTVTVYEEKI